MRNNAFWKDLRRAIYGSKARFLSILAMIALGAGFFSGINATKPDMILSADTYFKDYNLSDFRLWNPLGFQEEDIEALSKIQEMADLTKSYSKDVFVSSLQETAVMKVFGFDEKAAKPQNFPRLEEGRLPQNKGEIILEVGAKNGLAVALGEEVTLYLPKEEEITDILREESYEVVGFFITPLYISFQRGQTNMGDGSIDYIGYVLNETFLVEAYTDLFIRTKGSETLEAYSKEYKNYHEPLREELRTLGILAMERDTKILREDLYAGQETLEKEKEEALAKMVEAEIELAEGREQLEQGKRDLEREEKEGYEALEKARKEVAQGKVVLQEGREAYLEGDAAWLQGYHEYQDARAELQEVKNTLELTKKRLDQGVGDLDQAKIELEKGQQQMALLESTLLGLEDIRDTLPEGTELTEEEYEEILVSIDVFSKDLAARIRSRVSYNDPNVLSVIRRELDTGILQLKNTLSEAKSGYEQGLLAYEEGVVALAEGRAAYEEGLASYKEGEEALDIAKKDLDLGKEELEEVQRTLDKNQKALAAGEADLLQGEKDLAEGLKEGREALLAAEKELAEGEATFKKEKALAEEKIQEAEEEILLAERALLEIPKEWFVYDRDGFPGYSTLGDDAERLGSLATVFPLFFFLVAALVCLTTMTRMVEEERIQIGTLKALGYTTGTIAMKYMIYGLSASILGSVLGFLVGFQLFPRVIITVYGAMYSTPYLLTPFHWDLALLSTAMAVVTTVSASLFATLSELRETPANLMMPKAPKPGKRILLERLTPLWKRMSFSYKVTFRNIFRYKKRFLMTVLGVSGCTALLVAGFGIRDSVDAIMGRQFDEIFLYDGMVVLDEEKLNQGTLSALLENQRKVEDFTAIHNESVMVHGQGETREYEVNLLVPENLEAFQNFYDLHERVGKAPISLEEDGAVITEKLADLLNVEVGDTLIYQDTERRTYEFLVGGIAENYLAHYIYMSPTYFQKLTLRDPVMNAGLFSFYEGEMVDNSAFSEGLLEEEAVLGTVLVADIRGDFQRSIASLDYVVYILILAAGALAFVVLYNLTNINITERLREIATIKVLGFRDKEVSAYVYRENIFLTIIGSLFGLLLGFTLHRFVILTMEIDTMMFGRDILLLSFVYAMVLTMGFSVLVNITMNKKLQQIDMAASLKSVE